MRNNYTKMLVLGFLIINFAVGGFAQNQYFLDFDGSNDYVKYTSDSKLEGMNGASNYTLEAWVYVDANCDNLADIMMRDNQFVLYYRKSSNSLGVGLYHGSWSYYHSDDNSLPSGGWHHIAVVRNTALSHYLQVYIDGSDVFSSTYNGYALRSSISTNLYIGNDGSGGHYFKGYIDEVRLSAAATSPSSLHSNKSDNEYIPNVYTKALLHFNEGTGTTTANEAYSSSSVSLHSGVTWRAWNYVSSDHLPLAYEWTGSSNTDWANTSNWASGSVPTATTDVLIPDALNDPIIGSSTDALANNLLLGNAASLTANASSTLSIPGKFTMVGTATFTDNGTTKFNGGSAQTIPTAAYNNLTIDNTSGVSLGGAVTVNGTLTLTNGILTSTSTNILTFSSTATAVSGGSDANHVEGPMAKVGNTAFIFPCGDAGKWARLGISDISASETFTVQYHKSTPASNTAMSDPITKVSDNEWWQIDRAGSATASITYYWQDSKWSGIGNFDDLRLGHWNGSAWEEVTGTYSHTGSADLSSALIGSLKVTGVSNFSPFAPASINNTSNTLPVELTSFELKAKGDKAIELLWQTASELNNDGFEIQRSTDAKNWKTLGFVNGAGSSNYTINYQYIDANPELLNYYRLKQVDYDGKSIFSGIKFIKTALSSYAKAIYPNPTDNVINVDISNIKDIQLYDAVGHWIKSLPILDNTISVASLPKGIYYLKLSYTDNRSKMLSFIKK